MDRRNFLQSFGAATGLGLLPAGFRAFALPQSPAAAGGKRLVIVMLRGAVDGLNVVVPYSEDNYAAMRPKIAVGKPGEEGGAIDLDGHFGLHPALADVMPLWSGGRLAFVHASGSPDPTRSHFDAQDYMESGTPGVKRTGDGWMNRLLGASVATHDPIEGLSLGPTLPRIFSGPANVANIPLGRDATRPVALDRPEVQAAFDRMYENSGAVGDAYREGRESRQEVLSNLSDPVSPESKEADGGAPPPKGFALDATQLATLMQRDPNVRLAFMQLGGWDTHVNQGGAKGQLANRLQPLGEGLAVFARQLGPIFNDTLVVVMSEFGRTAHENGNGGTDHGHGNVMWVMGGGVAGGRVYGDWPGVDDASLHEQRDLAVTTDFRSVLIAACEQHLRIADRPLADVFPKAPAGGGGVRGLLRA